MQMSTILNTLKNPRYAIIAITISVLLSVLFWSLTFNFTPTPLPKYIQMYGTSFTAATVSMGFVIAILTGLNISLVLCRKHMTGS